MLFGMVRPSLEVVNHTCVLWVWPDCRGANSIKIKSIQGAEKNVSADSRIDRTQASEETMFVIP